MTLLLTQIHRYVNNRCFCIISQLTKQYVSTDLKVKLESPNFDFVYVTTTIRRKNEMKKKNECREQFANMYFTWDTKCIKHFMRCDLEGNIITLRGNANSNTFLMQMCCVWSLYKLYIYGWQNTTKKKYMSSKYVFQIIKLSDLRNMVNSYYTVINRPRIKYFIHKSNLIVTIK